MNSARRGENLCGLPESKQQSRDTDRVGRGRKTRHGGVVWIEPVGVLGLGKLSRVGPGMDRVAAAPGAMTYEPATQTLPRFGVERALGHELQPALLFVLINGDLEQRPVPVGRLDPR